MKKAKLLLSLCLLLVLFSCKKHSSTPNTVGTLTVTIGGKAQTFNVGAEAHLDHTGDFYSLGIIGVQSTTASNSLILTITSQAPITAKSYTDANSEAQMSYTMTSGSIYQDDGTGGTSATITIKSISTTNVQGTFSGNLAIINGDGAATQALTSGTFNLAIE